MTRFRHAHARAALGLVAAATLLAACSNGHPDPPSHTSDAAKTPTATSAAPRPAKPVPPITLAAAQAALDRYVKINNAANAHAATSIKTAYTLNDEIEAGPLQAESRAEYKQYPHWTTKDEKDSLKPFYYSAADFYIPRTTPGQQPFFMATAHPSRTEAASRVLLTFVRVNTTTWKMVSALWLDDAVPPLAKDADGYATALPATVNSLAMRPADLTAAVDDNFSTGGTRDGRALAATTATKRQRGVYKDGKTRYKPLGQEDYLPANNNYPQTYSLALRDGGALTVAASSHIEHEYVLTPTAAITPSGGDLAWVTKTRRSTLDTTFVCTNAAAVPPKGLVRLLGYDCEYVKVS